MRMLTRDLSAVANLVTINFLFGSVSETNLFNRRFLPARRSKRGTCYGSVAGWLAGCPSHAGIVSKRLNIS